MLVFFDNLPSTGKRKLPFDKEGHLLTGIDSSEAGFFKAINESDFTERLNQNLNPDLLMEVIPRSYCGAVFRVEKLLGVRCMYLPLREPITFGWRWFEKLFKRRMLQQETFCEGRFYNKLWFQDIVLATSKELDDLIPVSLPYSTTDVPRKYFLHEDAFYGNQKNILIVFIRLGSVICPVARFPLNASGYLSPQFDMRNVFTSAVSLWAGHMGLANQNEISSVIRGDFETFWDDFVGLD